MTETSIDALFEEINELKQKNKELKRENQTLKLKYKNECLLNENKRLKCEDVFDSFIRGQESEKRINPKNKEYQERIDYTLKLLRNLEQKVNKVMCE